MLRRPGLTVLFLGLFLWGAWPPLHAQRIKDIARVQGIRDQQMKGIGLVTGLSGTGDSQKNDLTKELYASVLEHLKINLPADKLRFRNLAVTSHPRTRSQPALRRVRRTGRASQPAAWRQTAAPGAT